VAAGYVLGAIGTDTGGSIRLPAACCGIVGLKATYGRISRAGAMPLSWAMDHIGPMARTVGDVAVMLEIMAGHDPLDSTSSPRPPPREALARAGQGIRGLRVGVPAGYFFAGIHAEVDAAVRSALAELERLGALVEEVTVPDCQPIHDVANAIARSESAAIHARVLTERPHELQPAVRARLEVGLRVTAHDYIQALRLRAQIARQFIREVFATSDVLVTPTIPEPAPALADVKRGTTEDVVARMGRFSRLTRPFNGLGLPALSVPCGFSTAGLPIAFQVVGRPFDEATLLAVGHVYEQATDWHRRRPALA
jgi:aspartyl-tRNA(Asn)/glutamyl-tRNA(Gln) amidotransferase subunit A